MFFFWGFPFVFLIPLFLAVLVFRVGYRYFRSHYKNMEEEGMNGYMEYNPYQVLSGRRDFGTLGRKSREAQIFKLAYRLKGRVTVSDIVVETGLSLDEAESLIESLVDGVRVRMEIDKRGIVIYEFPEILARFENEEESS